MATECVPAVSDCKEREYSEAVKIISRCLDKMLWKIRDLETQEMQEAYMKKFFTYVGKMSGKEVSEVAKDMLELKLAAETVKIEQDKKKVDGDESKDEIKPDGNIEDLYAHDMYI